MKMSILTIRVALFAALLSVAPGAPKEPSPDEVARMEQAAPSAATVKPKKARKLLVVNQCEGFPHSSVPYGAKAFEVMGKKSGAFSTVVVNDLSILEKPEFDTFDAIVINNATVRLPLLAGADEAREARAQKRFLDFIRNGKGLVGVHAATDALYKWPEYGELIGGYFSGHPWHEDVRVKLDDPGHPLLAAFSGQGFNVTDEIYQFREPYSRDKLRVLLSLDADKVNMDKKGIKREDKDFAVAWTRAFGKGRVFYFSLGHRHEIFWNAPVLQCYLDGIQYALGDLPADATPSSQLKDAYLEQSRATAFTAGLENLMAGVAGYKLDGGSSVAAQLDAFVDEHMDDGRACRDALSKGLAAVAGNPQATAEGRALACRKLSLVGTDNAVPVLAKLVSDKALGNWARYALARIPGSAADTALVEALNRTSGQDRLAVVALVGQRGAKSGAAALAALVTSDSAVAVAAAEALGRIGAVDALARLQSRVDGNVRLAVDRAVLDCGESARAAGDSAAAGRAYALLASARTAAHVRAAAYYGSNLASGPQAAIKALRGDDPELARAGARLVKDQPGGGLIAAIGAALKGLPPANQVLTIDALRARGDRAAQGAVLAMVASGITEVRAAALRALEKLGDGQAVTAVIAVASAVDIDALSRDTARRTLNNMNGPGVDEAIAGAMRSAELKTKIEYVKVLGARKGRGALKDLLAAACDADVTLAKEARKAVGMLARAEDLPLLVGLLSTAAGSSTLRQIEGIVVKAAATTDDPELKTRAVVVELKQRGISVEARCTLLGALGRIGAAPGLPALESAFKDGDAGIRRAAIKAVSEQWPDATPARALRSVSRNDEDEGCRVLALRGYARMLAMPSERLLKETLELYREGLDLAKGAQEKRALIAGLGRLAHPDALAFVKPFLEDKEVQGEALLAAVSITEGLNGNAMVLTGSVGKGTERNAIDGNPETRWTSGAHMQGGEWFMVDLGYETDIKEIYLDAGATGHDQPRGYELYLSLDGKNWGDAVVKGGDPNTRAFTITVPSRYGRFIKVVQTGVHGLYWSINEIRINGLPDRKTLEPLDRANWKVTASRSPGNGGPELAIDGDLEKRWGTGGAMQRDDWFAVDLGEERTVHAVIMNAAKSGSDYPREYRIYTSMDGKEWYGPIGAGKGERSPTKVTVLPTRARHVKIAQTGSHERNWWSIYDLQIFGE
jgi:type 1 glutamine amidotransferase